MRRTRKDSNFDAYMGKTHSLNHTQLLSLSMLNNEIDVPEWFDRQRERKKRKGEKVQFDVQSWFSIRKIRVFLEIRESIVFQQECELG